MKCQMILVISSPSISTTGFTTLILDMPLLFPSSLRARRGPGARAGQCCAGSISPGDEQAGTECCQDRHVSQSAPRCEHARPPLRQRQPGQGGCEQNASHRQRTPLDILSALPHPHQRQGQAAEHDRVGELPPPRAGRPARAPPGGSSGRSRPLSRRRRHPAGARRGAALPARAGRRRRGVPHRASSGVRAPASARPLGGFPGMCLLPSSYSPRSPPGSCNPPSSLRRSALVPRTSSATRLPVPLPDGGAARSVCAGRVQQPPRRVAEQ